MSTDRSAPMSSDLAGEASPSHSEGLRPDTRTSNSEDWESQATVNPPESSGAVKGDAQRIQLLQKIKQLEQETAGPERRMAAKARQALMKEVQQGLSEPGKSTEEKVAYMESVFAKQIAKQAKLENQLIPMTRQSDNAVKERDAAVDEKARVVELNSKLHELCRELRKENALLLDTSKAISAQELNQRKALTENFQETVEGITKRLEEHERDRLKVVTENDILKKKLKALCDQYEARDSHYNQQMQTKELELKMASIKLQDQALLVDRADMQSKKMAEAFAQMQAHKSESDKLLESYNDRFTECQQSIEKSNEVFQMLRQDGERKNQAIKQAEKDKKALHKQLTDLYARYEQASAGLVQLTQESANLKKQDSTEKTRLKAQKEKLENLCRLLRAENTKLKESVNDQGAVPGEVSELAQITPAKDGHNDSVGAKQESTSVHMPKKVLGNEGSSHAGSTPADPVSLPSSTVHSSESSEAAAVDIE